MGTTYPRLPYSATATRYGRMEVWKYGCMHVRTWRGCPNSYPSTRPHLKEAAQLYRFMAASMPSATKASAALQAVMSASSSAARCCGANGAST